MVSNSIWGKSFYPGRPIFSSRLMLQWLVESTARCAGMNDRSVAGICCSASERVSDLTRTFVFYQNKLYIYSCYAFYESRSTPLLALLSVHHNINILTSAKTFISLQLYYHILLVLNIWVPFKHIFDSLFYEITTKSGLWKSQFWLYSSKYCSHHN